MGSVADNAERAIVPIGEALPELRAEQYAQVREWDAARMALAGEFDAADGEYLRKIRDALRKAGYGLWTKYLHARGLPESTAYLRIQKAEGRYVAPVRTPSHGVLPEPGPPLDMVMIPTSEYQELKHRERLGEAYAAEHGYLPYQQDYIQHEHESKSEAPASLPMIPQPERVRSFSVAAWDELHPDLQLSIIEQGRECAANLNKQDTDNIEWARWSWNPVTGCLHNCPYCYARDIANRFYPQGFAPTFHPERLGAPFHQRVPTDAEHELGWRNIFTCSMADLFGKWVPAEWIEAVLNVARDCPQWNFLFLTKFPNRLAEFEYPPNAWLGTSVDCQARVKNAERSFKRVRGGVKWLSVEPMLEPLHFDALDMFDWVVVGGASASTQTPAWNPPRQWVLDLEADARAAGCMIYEKTNLGIRLREYPGWEREVVTLPPSLQYLPSIG